jgi:hypothetical protein
MTVAHPVQKRRVPRNAPRLCGSVRREVEKHLPRRPDLRMDPPVLRLNDCLAWLVPRGKARARRAVPKKLLDFFDKDLFQGVDFERFLVDHGFHVIDKESLKLFFGA